MVLFCDVCGQAAPARLALISRERAGSRRLMVGGVLLKKAVRGKMVGGVGSPATVCIACGAR